MSEQTLKLLLVEDNPGDVRLLRVFLQEARASQYQLVHFVRLEDALAYLDCEPVAMILLDLSLPDSHGMETLRRVVERTTEIPIIVLTGTDDEHLAVSALQSGAQDYLVKGQTDSNLLLRAMRYAFERQRMQSALRSLSLTDELTGLYNRRGFLTLAEHQLKVAYRMQEAFVLVYLDIDGMKIINDTYGHQEGDQALIETAAVLRSTFRESDIVARIGGDEFVVIGLDGTQEQAQVLPQRLQAAIDARNNLPERGAEYRLSISIGLVDCQPGAAPMTIESLLAQADALMYQRKRAKKLLLAGDAEHSPDLLKLNCL